MRDVLAQILALELRIKGVAVIFTAVLYIIAGLAIFDLFFATFLYYLDYFFDLIDVAGGMIS